jgi:hypothetical protein
MSFCNSAFKSSGIVPGRVSVVFMGPTGSDDRPEAWATRVLGSGLELADYGIKTPPDPVRQLTGSHDLCAEALRQRTVQGFLELLMPLISFTILVSI